MSCDKCIGRDELICRLPPHFTSEEALDFQLLSFAVFEVPSLNNTMPRSQVRLFLTIQNLPRLAITIQDGNFLARLATCAEALDVPFEHFTHVL